jgi:hypothetical protein
MVFTHSQAHEASGKRVEVRSTYNRESHPEEIYLLGFDFALSRQRKPNRGGKRRAFATAHSVDMGWRGRIGSPARGLCVLEG